MNRRIPVTVFTGFLGSGKTTVLRHLLTTSNLKLAVMVNEFGSVGLDGDLIKTCGFCPEDEDNGKIVELNNGCLCCTVQDDFLPTIEYLLVNSSSLDGIVIETSGLALPRPLIQALEWPEIKSKVYLNAVVTVVDAQALSLGSPVGDMLALENQRNNDQSLDHLTPVNELFENQLKAADIVLISRADLLPESTTKSIVNDIENSTYSGTSVLAISHGKVDSSLILDIKLSPRSKRRSFEPSLDHDHDHDHDHVDVFSDHIQIEGNFSQKLIEELLINISKEYQVLRLKGRLWLTNKKLPLQVQMVGRRLTTWFEQAPSTAWKPQNGGLEFVIISLKEEAKNAISEALS